MVEPSDSPRLGMVRVLTAKYFVDVLKSPGLLGCCVFPVLFLALFKAVVLNDVDHEDALAGLLGLGVVFSSAMIPASATVYPMAEAREKHLLRTLLLAGVRRGQMLAARALASTIYVALVSATCYLVAGGGAQGMLAYLPIAVSASIPMTALSLLLGLASRNQMAANFSVLPIVLVGIAPMLFVSSPEAFGMLPILPTGGGLALAIMLEAGTLLSAEALLPAAAQFLWIVAAATALAAIAPRIPRDDA